MHFHLTNRRIFSPLLLLVALITLLLPAGPAAAQSAPAPGRAARVNVAIQAGHWKSAELPAALARLRGSTGASGGGRREWQVNLDIATRAARILRAEGLTVDILPATVPTGYQADLFIALHVDGNSSSAARGYKVSTRWRSNVAALDAALVTALTESYGAVTGLPEDPSVTRAMRGYYAYSTYRGQAYRLGGATPAAILEMGFMTSPADRALLFYQPERVAQGVVAGIHAFYRAFGEARGQQAGAARVAAAAPAKRGAVVLVDGANIRLAPDGPVIGHATMGQSFGLVQAPQTRPVGGFDPRQGTQLVSGSGWYKIVLPGRAAPAYLSRDVVVVQQ